MKKSIKKIVLVVTMAFSLLALFFLYQIIKTIIKEISYQQFTLTIHNNSDYDIELVEVGLVSGTSKQIISERIKPGNNYELIPDLSFVRDDEGEGSIYFKYMNSNKIVDEVIACGYTEYFEGKSVITITNKEVQVKQYCR